MARTGRPTAQKNARHFLREWREEKGLTQEDVAEAVRTVMRRAHDPRAETFNRDRVSKAERGIEGLPEDMVYIYADALDVQPGWLFIRPAEAQLHEELAVASPEDVERVLNALRALRA